MIIMTMSPIRGGVPAAMYARQVRLDELETRDFPWTVAIERIDFTTRSISPDL